MQMHRRTDNGFSLIELMTAIAVLAVLFGLAVPTFVQIINDNRLTTQANELVSALNYARSEAVKRGDNVSICASTNGTTCSGSNAWNDGWIAFTDSTGTGGTLDASDALLQVWPATGGLALTTNGASVRYQSSGMVVTTRSFTLQKAGCTGPRSRQVGVALTGRVRTLKQDCT
jgi:type IV fimbrial biogenesis protein FimT